MIKIYRTKPKGDGWEANEYARTEGQAKSFVLHAGYYKNLEVRIVKTKKDIYPYTIFIKKKMSNK